MIWNRNKKNKPKKKNVIDLRINWSNFDMFSESIEKYVNRQGYTFGIHAELIQQVIDSINLLYINKIVTSRQCSKMNDRLFILIYENLKPIKPK